MPDEELEKILERIFNKEEEEKEMNYFVTISQESDNKIELTANHIFIINQLVEYINETNRKSDAKLSVKIDPIIDPVKED